MISTIKMNGVASYTQPETIDGLKKFNFFYGLNGTGKTTITNFLAIKEGHEKFHDYKKCSIDPENVKDTHEVFVYNQEYIDRIFRRNPEQPSIFSLGEKDVDAEKKIEAAKKEKKLYEQELEPINAVIEQIETAIEESEKNISKALWKEEQPQKNTSSLEYCLRGAKGSKKAFFEKVLSTQLNKDDNIDLKELENEADKIQDEKFKKKPIYDTLPIKIDEIENNKILNKKIVGHTDSYLADLIEKFDNYTWVKTGIEEYLSEENKCPFCQQEITEKRKTDLKELIDETYKEKETKLESLKNNYIRRKQEIEKLIEEYREDTDIGSAKIIKENADLLKERLKGNLQLLKNKNEDPSKPVRLNPSISLIQKINSVVAEQNKKNEFFNDKITDKKSYEEDIKSRYWKGLRQKYNDRIKDYKTLVKQKNKELGEKKAQKKQLNEKIKEQEEIILSNRVKNTTVQEAIDYINNQLENVGFEGFYIENVGDKSYKLNRPSSTNEDTFSTLSEGEKTIITFLYFLQQCLGSESQEESPNLSHRIVVIDDPISSLSFPLVFEVAALIKEFFLNKNTQFAQLFILTHHLYFYHELINRNFIDGNDKSYYRISKNEHTILNKMEKDEIKNDYQSYWILLKDIKNGNAPAISLPNTMRNILEHYFSFISQSDYWKKTIGELRDENKKDPSIKALKRYVDRESHSDLTNLIDTKDFDVERFFHYFRSIFKKTGHLKHYQKMMDEKV